MWPLNSTLTWPVCASQTFTGMLVAGRSNLLAVGADRHAPDFIAVLGEGQGFLALVTLERGRVPDADGPVRAGRGEAPAVRAERHAPALAGVSAQAEHLPAGRRVPDAHRLVFAARGEAPAVRAEGDAPDESGMRQACGGARRSSYPTVPRGRSKLAVASRSPSGLNASALTGWRCAGKVRSSCPRSPRPRASRLPASSPVARRRPSRLNATLIACLSCPGEGVQELTVLPVPDPHHPVSSRRELSAVGTERHGIRRPKLVNGVARVGEHLLAGRQVPDLHLLVRADGGQVLAVGVERDADDRSRCVRVRVWITLARLAVPDLDGPVPARGGESFAVRAERHAVDLRLVPEDQRLDPAEPHEVMPFPLAQVFRTLVEELQGAAQVVRGQLAVGQGDAVEVRVAPLALGLGQGLGLQRVCRRPAVPAR